MIAIYLIGLFANLSIEQMVMLMIVMVPLATLINVTHSQKGKRTLALLLGLAFGPFSTPVVIVTM